MSAVDFKTFVDQLATRSGEAILPFFRTAIGVDNKRSRCGVFDPVTEADRAAENIMRRLISETFPDHGIIGEEFGNEGSSKEYVWILDPIDGTKSFIGGMPTWGTLIGLMRNGHPIFGMMHQPFVGEKFWGDGKASGCIGPRGERPLRTRPCARLSDAMLYTTSPLLMNGAERLAFSQLEDRVKMSRYGGDCYAYCLMAAGHIDLVVEAGLKAHDIAPLIPIIHGAGGIVTTWQGEDAAKGGRIIAAGDKRIHAEALEILSKAPQIG
jgi:myo-inositol-1(or 4)-monophosphatase